MQRAGVPGSLLLAGEYRITEPGGQGIALAVAPHGRLTVSDSAKLTVECRFETSRTFWSPNQSPSQGLPGDIAALVAEHPGLRLRTSGAILADTAAFSRPGGPKIGYGSSAAAAVLLAAGMAEGARDAAIANLAVSAHRRHQGGRGSGYDVLTSFYGGCGLFTGGETPLWQPVNWPGDIKAWILSGPSPVSTSMALAAYETWKKAHPDSAREYACRLDEILSDLIRNPAAEGSDGAAPIIEAAPLIRTLAEAAEAGVELGDMMGVGAKPLLPAGLGRDILDGTRGGIVAKCLGAGDELILIGALPDALGTAEEGLLNRMARRGKARILTVETKGLHWEDEE